MAAYNTNHVVVGPGTLYAAPLGTTEPTSLTGAWTGWTELGYTDAGSEFSAATTFAEVSVEEEIYPVRQSPTSAKASFKFALAEYTAQNVEIALNDGLGSSLLSTSNGVNGDGSLWVEPPAIGTEARLMIGWDSLIEGTGIPSPYGPYGRIILRQSLSTEGITTNHNKGNKKTTLSCTFMAEKPPTLQPYRFIFAASFGS